MYASLRPENFIALRWIETTARSIIPKKHLGSVTVAGGVFKNALVGAPSKDLDIFCLNEEVFKDVAKRAEKRHGAPTYETPKSIGFKTDGGLRIDIVSARFGTPEQILDSFDFTVTRMALTPMRGPDDPFASDEDTERCRLIAHPDFFEHLHMKRLVIESDSLPFPLSTFERTYRYTKYGYTLCKESKVRLLMQVASLDSSAVTLESMSQGLYEGMD